ncbi:MAG TPA: M2 family metallopeptidase [Nannocystaceae bacterium]|nr:M2 family metallopeptidase [Nannocystaceae bacterium]
MRTRLASLPCSALLLLPALAACGPNKKEFKIEREPISPAPAQVVSAPDARAFVDRVDADLRELLVAASAAEWEKNTNITDATEAAAAKANEKVMEYLGRAIREAGDFGTVGDPDTYRKLHLLGVTSSPPPAPSDAAKREELAALGSKMEGIYGKGKHCVTKGKKETCRDLGELSDVIAASRDYDELLDAWKGWHQIAREIRPLYARFVALANEGAHELGAADLGQLWRAAYDMTPAQFEAESERLWEQVQPLYEQLHCYVRAELGEKYGTGRVPQDGLIPAHLLGNMWAQEWGNIYPLVTPYPGKTSIDVTAALKSAGYDEIKMVKLGESFFTSLGLDPLPQTFWERSMFQKPEGREVVCHASAWDVNLNDDLRIKMCIKINAEDMVTIHHELGHNYYYHYYYKLPVLFQNGAHDGFHEAIGDAIALSITPRYLKKIGLIDRVAKDKEAVINQMMQDALDKIGFLPFGKLIDQWRWDVFSGKITPDRYNAGWWELRAKYQGVAPPEPRSEEDFDAGAKYHIPANVPYTRYFLARILQFQFHKALCEAAGHEGPLHECSIYGSKEAGARLQAMLELGASRPWPDALEALTGSRQMDAGPMIEYFEPLSEWLAEQNKGRTCGWK